MSSITKLLIGDINMSTDKVRARLTAQKTTYTFGTLNEITLFNKVEKKKPSTEKNQPL